MKTTILILSLFTLLSCSKKDDPTLKPIDKLPPLTHTGANTAGCLVNGEAFLPKGHFTTGNLKCFYINQKDFTLGISQEYKDAYKGIYIYVHNTELQAGSKYYLTQNNNLQNTKYAKYEDAYYNNTYSTTLTITGELIITHHNYNNATISGTFWFDAVNSDGEKVEVREGRFDMEY